MQTIAVAKTVEPMFMNIYLDKYMSGQTLGFRTTREYFVPHQTCLQNSYNILSVGLAHTVFAEVAPCKI